MPGVSTWKSAAISPRSEPIVDLGNGFAQMQRVAEGASEAQRRPPALAVMLAGHVPAASSRKLFGPKFRESYFFGLAARLRGVPETRLL